MTTAKSPLTDIAVKKAAPRATRFEIPDGKVRGLFLVVFPSGAKSWVVRYRHGGGTRKLTIGRYPDVTLSKARAAMETHHGVKAGGKDPAAEKQKLKAIEAARKAEIRRQKLRPTVADLC